MQLMFHAELCARNAVCGRLLLTGPRKASSLARSQFVVEALDVPPPVEPPLVDGAAGAVVEGADDAAELAVLDPPSPDDGFSAVDPELSVFADFDAVPESVL